MARRKITISEEAGEMLDDLMASRELEKVNDAADLAIRVGYNRLAALDRHKKVKAKEARANKKTGKEKAKKKSSKKKTSRKRSKKK